MSCLSHPCLHPPPPLPLSLFLFYLFPSFFSLFDILPLVRFCFPPPPFTSFYLLRICCFFLSFIAFFKLFYILLTRFILHPSPLPSPTHTASLTNSQSPIPLPALFPPHPLHWFYPYPPLHLPFPLHTGCLSQPVKLLCGMLPSHFPPPPSSPYKPSRENKKKQNNKIIKQAKNAIISFILKKPPPTGRHVARSISNAYTYYIPHLFFFLGRGRGDGGAI